jgi:hypothetical protein
MGRLIWFHVPPRLTPKTLEEIQSGERQRSIEEMNKVMEEKRMALDLIEGFVGYTFFHIQTYPFIDMQFLSNITFEVLFWSCDTFEYLLTTVKASLESIMKTSTILLGPCTR